MATCPLDDNGYCPRHKTRHQGKALEFALADSELGEKYRRLWDRQLGLETPRKEVAADAPKKSCRCRKGSP